MPPATLPTTKSKITLLNLQRSPLFARLSLQTAQELSSRLRVTVYNRRTPIFTPGNELSRTYFLLSGSVKVSRLEASDGKELILYLVKPGEPFGAMPFTMSRDLKRVAVAYEKSRVGVLGKNEWKRLLENDPAMYRALLELAGQRLQQLQERMAEIAYREIPCRLARLLLRLSKEYKRKRECGVQIRLPLTQQDISDFIAATREMTSLTINDFKRNGWIAVHNRRICIHKPRSLRKIAE
jgi:CRP/FNR family transcriptional regulator